MGDLGWNSYQHLGDSPKKTALALDPVKEVQEWKGEGDNAWGQMHLYAFVGCYMVIWWQQTFIFLILADIFWQTAKLVECNYSARLVEEHTECVSILMQALSVIMSLITSDKLAWIMGKYGGGNEWVTQTLYNFA